MLLYIVEAKKGCKKKSFNILSLAAYLLKAGLHMTWPTQIFVVVKDESRICLFVVLVNVTFYLNFVFNNLICFSIIDCLHSFMVKKKKHNIFKLVIILA